MTNHRETNDEIVSEAIYREIASNEALIEVIESWMVDGVSPTAEFSEQLVRYMRKLPAFNAPEHHVGFRRAQPSGVAPHARGWASWTTSHASIKHFETNQSEVFATRQGRGISLEELGIWRTRLTGQYHYYGTQGEWLLLNDSVEWRGVKDLSAIGESKTVPVLKKWPDATHATKAEIEVEKLVDVCGNLAAYSLGPGRHAFRTFGPDEVVPSLDEAEKSAPSPSMGM